MSLVGLVLARVWMLVLRMVPGGGRVVQGVRIQQVLIRGAPNVKVVKVVDGWQVEVWRETGRGRHLQTALGLRSRHMLQRLVVRSAFSGIPLVSNSRPRVGS